jgi:hypothetical protein
MAGWNKGDRVEHVTNHHQQTVTRTTICPAIYPANGFTFSIAGSAARNMGRTAATSTSDSALSVWVDNPGWDSESTDEEPFSACGLAIGHRCFAPRPNTRTWHPGFAAGSFGKSKPADGRLGR